MARVMLPSIFTVADGGYNGCLNATEDATSPRTIEDILQTRLDAGNLKSGGSETYQQADFLYVLKTARTPTTDKLQTVGHGWRKG